jgi:hypothetical protein
VIVNASVTVTRLPQALRTGGELARGIASI